MKSLKNILIRSLACGLCAVAAYACSPEYMTYDISQQDGVYFSSDSIGFQFGMNTGETYPMSIYVGMLGSPKDYDRTFSVEVVTEETTAVEGLHYTITPTFTVAANAVSGSIPVTLIRYEDPELAQHPFVLTLRLKDNDNFRVVMKEKIKLEFSDEEMPRPYWWQDRFLGPYSQLLMIDILHYYWAMEETHNALYKRMVAGYGREFQGGSIGMGFPYQFQIAFIKYVITPAYEYYLEHPNEKVNLPDPQTLY